MLGARPVLAPFGRRGPTPARLRRAPQTPSAGVSALALGLPDNAGGPSTLTSRLLKNPRRRGRVARGRAPQSAAYEPQARPSKKRAARTAANRRRGGEPGPARPAPRRTGPVFQHPARSPSG